MSAVCGGALFNVDYSVLNEFLNKAYSLTTQYTACTKASFLLKCKSDTRVFEESPHALQESFGKKLEKPVDQTQDDHQDDHGECRCASTQHESGSRSTCIEGFPQQALRG